MSESNRTADAHTALSSEMADFLETEAESLGIDRSTLLRRLLRDYRTSVETGLTCPHCDNEVRIDLTQ